jgi:hypothetical protein
MNTSSRPTPAQKVRVLEGSLRCFVLGLCSLVPLFGAGFAVAAFRAYARVRRDAVHAWNPARAYLCWGYAFSWLGALVTLGVVLACLLAVCGAAFGAVGVYIGP